MEATKYKVLALITIFLTFSHGLILRCEEPGLVAITFDDGPDPATTAEVMDVFAEFNLSTTFFFNGIDNFEPNETRYRETVTRAFNEGHQIGSHSWSHYNMTLLTGDEIREELRTVHNLIYDILGINMTTFRPPYGCYNDLVVEIAEMEFGYEIILWNVDTADWSHPADIEAGLKAWIDAIDGEVDTSYIGLHHDPTSGAGELARQTIEFVTSRGFKVVTVDECIKPKTEKKV